MILDHDVLSRRWRGLGCLTGEASGHSRKVVGGEAELGRLAPLRPCLATIAPNEILGYLGGEDGLNTGSFVPFTRGQRSADGF